MKDTRFGGHNDVFWPREKEPDIFKPRDNKNLFFLIDKHKSCCFADMATAMKFILAAFPSSLLIKKHISLDKEKKSVVKLGILSQIDLSLEDCSVDEIDSVKWNCDILEGESIPTFELDMPTSLAEVPFSFFNEVFKYFFLFSLILFCKA